VGDVPGEGLFQPTSGRRIASIGSAAVVWSPVTVSDRSFGPRRVFMISLA